MAGVTGVASPSEYMTCYIYNMITDEKIVFETLPDGVSESFSANWNSQDIAGRTAPYFSYNNTEARTVDYSVKLFRDILGDNAFIKTVNQCRNLVYPKYLNSSIVQPPYCYIRFGGMVHMYAIVNSVSISWGDTIIADDSTNANSNYFSTADISFSFTELITTNGSLPTANRSYLATSKSF